MTINGTIPDREKKMAKTLMFIFAVSLGLALISPCYCQDYLSEEEQQFADFSGAVTAVDWVASTVVVNDVSFKVEQNTVIIKGTDTIGFSSINIGDQVDVKFYKDSAGELIVTNMVVKI